MKKLLLLLILSVGIMSCSEKEEGKKRVLVASKGLPSELLLVVDKDLWLSDIKDSINAIVEAQVPGLMQAEKMFRVTRVFTPDHQKGFLTFHTKLFVHVDTTLVRPMLGSRRNEYAKPQFELFVVAPSADELRTYLMYNADHIKNILADAQIDMRVDVLKKKYSKKISDELKQVLGMDIRVPENFVATKKGKNFFWGGTNLLEKDLNIVVYTYDWQGEELSDADDYAEKRDSVMQHNIPGSLEGQWMQTVRERENNKPLIECDKREVNGRSVVQVRGLWEMRNGAMGGPFVCIARIDTASRKVIVGEGFVYSPSTEKRDLVRQMEATLRTLK